MYISCALHETYPKTLLQMQKLASRHFWLLKEKVCKLLIKFKEYNVISFHIFIFCFSKNSFLIDKKYQCKLFIHPVQFANYCCRSFCKRAFFLLENANKTCTDVMLLCKLAGREPTFLNFWAMTFLFVIQNNWAFIKKLATL